MPDYQDQVDELLAEYRRSRERLVVAHQELAAIRETATSSDRTVTAVVGPQGVLSELTLSEEAYRRHAPAALAKLIVRTTAEAAERAARRAQDALAPVLPPDADPAAVLAGRADIADAEIMPPEPPAGPEPRPTGPAADRRADEPRDDEMFDDRSWLRSGAMGRAAR